MVSQIKGPAIFLAQFIGDQAPFDSLENITRWAAGLGYKGVQIPTIDKRVFDLELAVSSDCLLYTSPSPRDRQKSRMPSSA